MFTEMLRKAALAKKTVDITYKKMVKSKNMTSEVKDYKNVEVYKIVGDRVWIYDTTAGHIKQFAIYDNDPELGVLFVKENETTYEPKYPIEVDEEKKVESVPVEIQKQIVDTIEKVNKEV